MVFPVTQEGAIKFRKIHCVVGGFLCIAIGSQIPILGNLGSYLESYLAERADLTPGSTWFVQTLIGCSLGFYALAMLPAGMLARRVGTAWTTLLGMALMTIVRTATFWSVQESAAATLLTAGVFNGIGSGLVMGCPFEAANKYKFSKPGLIYGVIAAGQSVCGIFFNFIITGYVNPHNEAPDVAYSTVRYFSQPAILDRVPFIFLLLSALYLVLIPVAVTGMRQPPITEENDLEIQSSTEAKSATERPLLLHASSSDDSLDHSPVSTLDKEDGVTTKDMLCQKEFYLLWFINFCVLLVSSTCAGLYKEMGLTQIHDDVYTTWLGTAGALCMTLTRPTWGLVADRVGLKMSWILQSGASCVLCAFWFWSLLGGRAFYFLWTMLIFTVTGSAYVLIVLATKTYFGNRHFFTNFGCVCTATTVSSIVAPLLTSASIQHLGWTGLTLVLASVCLASLLSSLLLPNDES